MILDEVKEEYVKDLLKKGKRADGRQLTDYREITVDKNVFQNTEGSAIAHIGDTKVVAGVKFDMMEPFADRPDEGVVMVNAEFSPMAHPDFYAGPPDERSIELARIVDRGIRSAKVVDVKKLSGLAGTTKVLGIFIDLYIIDHCGNLIDTAALAAMSALCNAKVPKVGEDGKIIRDQTSGPLAIARRVTASTFEKIDGKLVLDATNEEEIASDGRMTIAVSDDGLVVAGQKSGRAGFSQSELMETINLSLEKNKQLVKYL